MFTLHRTHIAVIIHANYRNLINSQPQHSTVNMATTSEQTVYVRPECTHVPLNYRIVEAAAAAAGVQVQVYTVYGIRIYVCVCPCVWNRVQFVYCILNKSRARARINFAGCLIDTSTVGVLVVI